jgi:hypothetical protein
MARGSKTQVQRTISKVWIMGHRDHCETSGISHSAFTVSFCSFGRHAVHSSKSQVDQCGKVRHSNEGLRVPLAGTPDRSFMESRKPSSM